VLEDGADLAGVYRALKSAGLEVTSPLEPDFKNSVDHVFVKSAVELTHHCRGRRHVLGTDYLGGYSWLIAKAVVHTLVTSVVGDPMMQVSGGGEHQGKPGGGALAVVTRKERK
jgi:cyanuric acid amidohydrolase